MDYSSLFDDPEEPLMPVRSPSRLDFYIPDLDDLESHDMDWSQFTFRDEWSFLDEETFPVEIAVAHTQILEDESPTVVDSQASEDTAEPDCSMHDIVAEPLVPIPIRLPEIELKVDSQEQSLPPRVTPQKLDRSHHGLSRSALLQRKTLWDSRRKAWDKWQSPQHQGGAQKPETDHASTGLATAPSPSRVPEIPPYMRTPPSGLERDMVDHPHKTKEQDFYSSIYPRVGDISALRDPYAVNIDLYFFRYPLWTIHKMLYVFNMHQRADPYTPVSTTAIVKPSQSSSSMLSAYSSSTSGSGTDPTFIAEENPVPPSQTPPEEPSRPASSVCMLPSWSSFGAWELSWYGRWELLIGLLHRNAANHEAFKAAMNADVSCESKEVPASPSERVSKFTIGGGEKELYDDDDDEDDYGTLVSHSTFNVDLDEEYERALAFRRRSELTTDSKLVSQ